MAVGSIFSILFFLEKALYAVVTVFGIMGLVTAVSTRGDAFSAADRQSKMVWSALLGGSTLVVGLATISAGSAFMLSIIGAVIIGVYWCDVRPQIRSILDGTYGF